MNRSRVAFIFVLFVAATANPTSAITLVNVDFGLHGDHPSGPTSVPYVGLGAAFNPGGTTWNNVEVLDNNQFTGPPGEFGFWTTTVSQSNLVNSFGVATPIGVSAIAGASNGTGAFGIVQTATNNLAAVATNAQDLMRDYLIGFDAPQQVVLNGFTVGTSVDLYLYGAGDTSNRDTKFTIVDTNGTHTATTTGTLTNDANAPVAHTLTLGADYIVLPGILPDNTGAITISYFHGDGSGEAPFNGLQAVYGIVPGDVDGDNDVDTFDYQFIRDNFRKTGATRNMGDLTSPLGGNAGDGVIDFYDFQQWQANFPTPGAGFGQVLQGAVPEPASIGLAMIVLATLTKLRRRQASATTI